MAKALACWAEIPVQQVEAVELKATEEQPELALRVPPLLNTRLVAHRLLLPRHSNSVLGLAVSRWVHRYQA